MALFDEAVASNPLCPLYDVAIYSANLQN